MKGKLILRLKSAGRCAEGLRVLFLSPFSSAYFFGLNWLSGHRDNRPAIANYVRLGWKSSLIMSTCIKHLMSWTSHHPRYNVFSASTFNLISPVITFLLPFLREFKFLLGAVKINNSSMKLTNQHFMAISFRRLFCNRLFHVCTLQEGFLLSVSLNFFSFTWSRATLERSSGVASRCMITFMQTCMFSKDELNNFFPFLNLFWDGFVKAFAATVQCFHVQQQRNIILLIQMKIECKIKSKSQFNISRQALLSSSRSSSLLKLLMK